jgi:hypothetical protein
MHEPWSDPGRAIPSGVTGDWDGMPDVDALALAVDESLAEVARAAGV